MDPRLIVPLPEGSPWASWARPDIHHCEANLAGLIAAPVDTWSNLAYFAAAAWLYRRKEPHAQELASVAAVVGATSFLFHASYTFAFQVLDYAGMFLYSSWIIALALKRAKILDETRASNFFWGLLTLSVLLVVGFHRRGWPVQPVFGVQAVAAVALELKLYRTRERDYALKPLLMSVGLAALAFVFWNLDHSDWFCRPDDHIIQGHAIWHLLTAASFIPAAAYFRQF